MKAWKLVAGILSIVFFLLVEFQSCAAGVVNSLEDNGDSSGSAGMFVGFLMLSGGIVSIVTRKAKKNGGNVALIILFGLAATIGFTNIGIFKDLAIWSGWCLINAFFALVSMRKNKKRMKAKADENKENEQSENKENDED